VVATYGKPKVAGYNERASGGVQIGKGSGLKRRRPQGLVGSSPTRRIAWVMKPQSQVEQDLKLSDEGLNNCEIARRIGAWDRHEAQAAHRAGVSVARREAVATMDRHVGPKR
jgi:hypothetical protein